MKNIYYLKELLPQKFSLDIARHGKCTLFGNECGLFRVYVYDCCSSSLDKAWELIREKRMNPGDSVLCFSQTKGRGRMGREWVSCRGNILAAWMIPYPEPAPCNNLLPLIMGLTLKRAMLNLGITLSIKWPNDLIYKNKKAGGILIEEKNNQLVAGIGLNLVLPEKNRMRESSSTAPGHLADHFVDTSPAEVWAKLVYLAHFWYVDILCKFSLIDFIREINSNLWLMGENISIESGPELIEGILTGIGEKGEIIVEQPTGVVRISSGSIRSIQPHDRFRRN